MNKNIAAVLKAFKLSIKDVISIEEESSLAFKVFLNKGRGAIRAQGWTEEIRRKKLPNGSYSVFRLHLAEPRFRARWNTGPWTLVED